jgi:UDP-N-acetylmuramoyl-L-alanyl-D-glutamate--2,6-diaminopimelate ligase
VRLRRLLAAAGLPTASGTADPEVTRAEYDSRLAGPGALFVAIPGDHVDGHAFASSAVAAGAVAVVAERDPGLDAGVPLALVPDSRAALAPLAARLLGDPSRSLVVAGVTGTDGKTTTTTMLHAAWRGAGIAAASMTTVDFRTLDAIEPNRTRQTTLEAADLQRRLRAALDAGVTHAAVETSSHALVLHRVDEVEFRVAVVLRVTSEHLDLHGTREAYLEAKAALVERVAARADGIAILDADDTWAYSRMARVPVATRLRVSAAGLASADLRATDVTTGPQGVRFRAQTPWGDTEVRLRVAGRFNAGNALAALAAACATGASLEGAVAGLERLERVGGRMERVDVGQAFGVVVDYAHTTESLRLVLGELRAATAGRVWVVFGSAGERDVEKRAEMGAVAAELADVVVVTDEDPRGEDRMQIIDAIAAGARSHGVRELHIKPDRAEAVEFAVRGAAAGDAVLFAGKGHESSIIGADTSIPWDERGAVEQALRRRGDGGQPH